MAIPSMSTRCGKTAWLGLLSLTFTGFMPIIAQAQETPRQAQKRQHLQDSCPDLRNADILRVLIEQPVVDTHAHLFNLAHLPIEGLLYKYPITPSMARTLTELLNMFLDTSPIGEPGGGPPTREALAPPTEGIDEARKLKLLGRLADDRDQIYDAMDIDAPVSRRTAGTPRSRAEQGLEVLENVSRVLVDDTYVPEPEPWTPTQIPSRGLDWSTFLSTPLEREDHMARALFADHPLVDVFVHHMMDMEHVYADRAEFDLATRLQRMQQLDTLHAAGGGPRTYFTVAFDPFRGPAGLDHVRKGIDDRAVAVKFYPPSGYRPSANVVPEKPRYWSRKFPFLEMPLRRHKQRKQWKSRYRNGHTDTGAALDTAVEDLFKLTHAEKIPVFSHHTPVGFESFSGYGRLMSEPCRWHEIIETMDSEKTFRLIVGHSGGGAGWIGTEPWEGSFDQQAYNLCVSYPNVYCDFGYIHEVLTAEGRAALAAKLAQLIAEGKRRRHEGLGEPSDPDAACTTTKNAPPRFAIESKILYGSDWFLVVKEKGQQEMVCSFARVFAEPALKDHHPAALAAGFFSENAYRALPRLPRQPQ